MSKSPRSHVPTDAVTGEVLEPDIAERRIREVADLLVEVEAERAHLRAQITPLADQLTRLNQQAHALQVELRHLVPVGSRIPAGDDRAVIVAPPPRRPAQTINKAACEAHARDLVRLGLGEFVDAYKPPTAAQIKAAAREVIAAGLPYHELLPDPGPGDPVVEVVTVDTGTPDPAAAG